jgi:hypothetical protein
VGSLQLRAGVGGSHDIAMTRQRADGLGIG